MRCTEGQTVPLTASEANTNKKSSSTISPHLAITYLEEPNSNYYIKYLTVLNEIHIWPSHSISDK